MAHPHKVLEGSPRENVSIVCERAASAIEVATAKSAAELVEALRPSNAHWWENGSCPWVFRGHANEEWSLLPSAWRPANIILRNCIVEASRRFDAVLPSQSLNWFWHPNYWSGPAAFGAGDSELARQLTIETTADLPIWDFAGTCDDWVCLSRSLVLDQIQRRIQIGSPILTIRSLVTSC
jgi:hypothetical protein